MAFGKMIQCAGMVGVFVRNQNFWNLRRFIAQIFQRINLIFNFSAEINLSFFVNDLIGKIFGRAGIDENNFFARVDNEILQTWRYLTFASNFSAPSSSPQANDWVKYSCKACQYLQIYLNFLRNGDIVKINRNSKNLRSYFLFW